MVFVTLFSLCSFEGVEASRFDIPHIDKAVHFTFYAVMVTLAFFAWPHGIGTDGKAKKHLWYILIFSIGYGIIIEVLQYAVTVERQGDVLDALANTVGAFTAMLAIRWLIFRGPPLK